MADLKMLAIDLGASSGRGIIGRFNGEKLVLEENHRFSNDPVMTNGRFYWDILRIFHEIKDSIRKCSLTEDRDIRSIGIDTWGVDYGLLDKNGRLIGNPVNYRDARTDGIQEYTFKTVSKEDIYKTTGIQFMNFNTIFQLVSELKENPNVFENVKDLLFVPDLLNYFLTGVKQTEYTIASTGAILDVNTRDYAFEMLAKLGIPKEIFSPIVMPGTDCAPLSAALQEETAIKDAKVVHVGAHDTASAVVSVPAKGDDFIYISSGTWSLMGAEINSPIVTDDSLAADFTNEGGAYGKIRFLKNIMGLWIEQESRRQWAREGEKLSFDQLSDMAMASKPLQSFINPDDLRFTGPGDMPRRIVEFCSETGQHVPENKGEIIRCIFDSLAMKYRWTVENIDRMLGRKTPFINIVGGGTKEAPLCQLTADACGRPVYAGPTEATALGNIAVQAIAAGEIKDLAEARHVIRNSFEIKQYDPKDTEMYDEAYERFLGICK